MFGSISYSENPLFTEFRRLEQEMDELLGGSTSWTSGIRSLPPGTFPAINVGGTDESVTVYLFAPGIDPKQLDISIQQNVLTVSGKREPQAQAQTAATYYRRERFNGEFRRVISLPEDVDPDKVEATYRDGIVQISVLRREATRPRQIEVR